MRRRALLALCGSSAAALAGCADAPTDGETNRQTETDASTATAAQNHRRVPMGRTVTVGDTSVTVADPRVRKAVVTRGVHTFVVAGAGQYVVASVTVDGAVPDRLDAVALRSTVGGDPVPDGDPVSTDDRFAFPFPTARHDAATVRWTADGTTVDWRLPDRVRERLAAEPAFRVRHIAVTRRDGERVLELEVENGGDRDGRFLARVSMAGFSGGSVVEFGVPAGESRTYRGRPGSILLYLQNQGGGTLTVQYPRRDGLTRLEHEVAAGTTTGTGTDSTSGS